MRQNDCHVCNIEIREGVAILNKQLCEDAASVFMGQSKDGIME